MGIVGANLWCKSPGIFLEALARDVHGLARPRVSRKPGSRPANDFIGKLAAFANAPAFETVPEITAEAVRSSGDPMSHRYTETVSGQGLTVELVWEKLEAPRALELTPDQVGTGEHIMFTLLVPAHDAQILVNGRALSGKLGTRVQAGYETTTAFLYFSETWIIPPEVT